MYIKMIGEYAVLFRFSLCELPFDSDVTLINSVMGAAGQKVVIPNEPSERRVIYFLRVMCHAPHCDAMQRQTSS